MNKSILILICFLYSINGTAQSVLESGTWAKLSTSETGMYKISSQEINTILNSMGLDASSVNPKNIAIYSNGNGVLPESSAKFRYENLTENPIEFVGEDDSSIDAEDYILFYNEGNDKWDINSGHTIESIKYKNQFYSNDSFVFITVKNTQGKRVSNSPILTSNGISINTYHSLKHIEIDENNLVKTGRKWVGETLGFNTTKSFNFEFDNLANTNFYYTVNGVFTNAISTQLNVNLDNEEAFNQNINFNSSYYESNKTGVVSGNSTTPILTLNYDNSSNPSGLYHIDFIDLKAESNLVYSDRQYTFFNLYTYAYGNIPINYSISNGNNARVWNVTDLGEINEMQNTNNGADFDFTINGYNLKTPKFIVFDNSVNFYNTSFHSIVENQNLKGLSTTEYVILTNNSLMTEAQELASFHNQNSGLVTTVVDVEKVYNEFSNGVKDITAIRDFFKYLRDNYNQLKYVLLFGDASYDYKGYLDSVQDVIPTWQTNLSNNLNTSYPSDDYYAMLDDNEGTNMMANLEIGIGRIPVSNSNDAQIVVTKIKNYNSSRSFGEWRNRITLTADDVDNGWETILQNTSEQIIANYIETNFKNYNLKKLYLDAFEQQITSTGERYPEAETQLEQSINQGAVILNYFGHGGETGWTQEKVLTTEKINNWNNYNANDNSTVKLPLVITLTCEFTRFDYLDDVSAGEQILLNNHGGGIGLISTTRAIGPSFGQIFNVTLIQHLLEQTNGQYARLGDVVKNTKNENSSLSNNKVILFGDPALRIALPIKDAYLTKINNTDVNLFNEPIKALDFITLEGIVGTNNTIDPNFNGEVFITIYDKEVNKQTKVNDISYSPMIYKERPNIIYKGKTTVTNGAFNFEFIVPQDIDYALGLGRFSLYAASEEEDASGVNDNITIGGINTSPTTDNEGPEIELYMNNTNFVNGGITNNSPTLIACLKDQSGINASGYAIGHDITSVMNQKIDETIVMNDFYQGGENEPCTSINLADYQKGTVQYPFSDLEAGEHQLVFKAWDVYNNSSTESLDFIVTQDERLLIKNLLNWPNPFTDKTYFQFEHNCPVALNITVQIFTVTGKLVKTIEATVSAEPQMNEGYRTPKQAIEWNGLDDYGDAIGKGVYIYKVHAKSETKGSCSPTESKFEKLVILK